MRDDFQTVREALAIGWPEGDHAEPNVFTDALAALSSIERHVQDMEKALRDMARASDDALKDGHPGLPDVVRLHRLAVAALDDVLAAALPAREKEEE